MVCIILSILAFLSIIFISILFFIINCIKINNHFNIMRIKNFDQYLLVLYFFMEKCYDIIYKEYFLVYSSEGMRVNDEQFLEASKKFVSFVIKMIGPNLRESYISFYGDEQTFYFNLMEFFNHKYETDEIFKATSEKIMDVEYNIKEEGINSISSPTEILTKSFKNSYNRL